MYRIFLSSILLYGWLSCIAYTLYVSSISILYCMAILYSHCMYLLFLSSTIWLSILYSHCMYLIFLSSTIWLSCIATVCIFYFYPLLYGCINYICNLHINLSLTINNIFAIYYDT